MKKRVFALLSVMLSVVLLVCAMFVVSQASENTPSVSIDKLNIALEDNVYIKYAVKLKGDEALAESGLGMLFWKESRAVYEKGSEYIDARPIGYQIISGEKYYIFSYTELSAKQMTDVIYARAYVVQNGTYYYSDVRAYSIVDYAANRLGLVEGVDGSTNADFKAMLRDMLAYGASAQKYFGYKTETLATDILTRKYEVAIAGGSLLDGSTGGTFTAGTEITLVAEERESFSFTHWEDENGRVIGTNPEQCIIVNASHTYAAKYQASGEAGELAFATSDGGATYYVKGLGTWKDSVVTVPETYLGAPVTAIGAKAFADCSSLTSIKIPDSVTSIGAKAFSGCSSLESLTIPYMSTVLGYYFGTSSYDGGVATKQTTTGLSETTYYIPASLQSVTVTSGNIPDGAFSGCSMLSSIKISDDATSIGWYAFARCLALSSIVIPKGITGIGDSAFYNCSGLETIYYSGTANDWYNIYIASSNLPLHSAPRYYYSATEPETTGNYWYYGENGEICIWGE